VNCSTTSDSPAIFRLRSFRRCALRRRHRQGQNGYDCSSTSSSFVIETSSAMARCAAL
jgi:hypothetical protein